MILFIEQSSQPFCSYIINFKIKYIKIFIKVFVIEELKNIHF